MESFIKEHFMGYFCCRISFTSSRLQANVVLSMKYKLLFIYLPDHEPHWVFKNKRLYPNKYWQEAIINADTKKQALDIAQKHVSEFTSGEIKYLSEQFV